MAMTGLLRRLRVPAGRHDGELRNPLSVLGPPPLRAVTATTGASGEPETRSTLGDRHTWEYLIASSSLIDDRPSWALMGPPAGVAVPNDATADQVASALAEQGWRMLTTSPPARSHRGTINYIFRRLLP